MENYFGKDFIIGCNYWASDVGIRMWEEFSEDTIKKDMKILSENGIKLLRVFPTWSYFQPIEEMLGYKMGSLGFSSDSGDTILFDNDESAGINEIAISRFKLFLNIAEQYDIKIIPALITGWMSGAIFAPKALMNKNLLTDPLALKWEIRFCKYFVKCFKDNNTIVAWDLGNECNCLAKVSSSAESWLWTASISNAIRSVDNTRPIISGMHSLGIFGESEWTFFNQAENCDILTTHPYASPENKTDLVPGDSFKAVLMPTVETKIYRGVSKKSCIIEETGTYGEMYMDDETTATYSYNCILNAWAHNCKAYLWWLGFDQGHLRYVPYGYNNRASNYGLFKNDYTPKEILKGIKKFNTIIEGFEFGDLPEAIVDGVCILPQNTSSIQIGSTVFGLAQQAGINLNFSYIEDVLPDAPLYIVPSLNSNSVSVNAVEKLMNKVENGAILYISASYGFFRNFAKDFGIKIKKMLELDNSSEKCLFEENNDSFELLLPLVKKFDVELCGAKAIAHTSDGNPLFFEYNYGKGKLFLLLSGFELWLSKLPHTFDKDYYKIYSLLKKNAVTKQILNAEDKFVTVSEHCLDNGNRIVVAINNQNKATNTILGNAEILNVYYGEVYQQDEKVCAVLNANDMVVFEICC